MNVAVSDPRWKDLIELIAGHLDGSSDPASQRAAASLQRISAPAADPTEIAYVSPSPPTAITVTIASCFLAITAVSRGVVVRERGGTLFLQIFWSRNGAPANIVGKRWNANTEAFRPVASTRVQGWGTNNRIGWGCGRGTPLLKPHPLRWFGGKGL